MGLFARDDYDDRRITLGLGSIGVQQSPIEWAFVDCSTSLYTDPRMHRSGADYVERSALRFVSECEPVASSKWCAACGEFVGLRLFRDDPLTWDGLSAWCRDCESIRGQRPLAKLVELPDEAAAAPASEGPAPALPAHRRHFLYALRGEVTLGESVQRADIPQRERTKPARAGRKRQSGRADRRAPYSTTGRKSQ